MLATITQKEIDRLRATNHVVAIYPRKRLVLVDGYKRFKSPIGAKPWPGRTRPNQALRGRNGRTR